MSGGMTLAVASGKGGTGKTTVAVGMALALGGQARLLDCDVEAPNCQLFLKAEIAFRETLGVPVPRVDKAKCTACGQCADICQFNAIAVVKAGAMVFAELCHGCGGCARVCPTGAVSETPREIGVLETGRAGGVEFVQGRLRVGEALAPPLIRAVKRHARPNRVNIVDCPPGTSCSMVAAVKGADFALLVTEPSPFGLHDLTLAVDTVRQIGVPIGVVINRADIGDGRVRDYCAAERIELLMEIREDRRIAGAYSRGENIVAAASDMAEGLRAVAARARALAARGKETT